MVVSSSRGRESSSQRRHFFWPFSTNFQPRPPRWQTRGRESRIRFSNNRRSASSPTAAARPLANAQWDILPFMTFGGVYFRSKWASIFGPLISMQGSWKSRNPIFRSLLVYTFYTCTNDRSRWKQQFTPNTELGCPRKRPRQRSMIRLGRVRSSRLTIIDRNTNLGNLIA